jgi:hypothetical protein
MLRKLEWPSGLLAGILGVAGLAYALFGPTYHYTRSATSATGADPAAPPVVLESGTQSLVQIGVEPRTVVFFVVMTLLFTGIAAGAYMHGRLGMKHGLILRWVCAPLLTLGVVLTGFSIGPLLLPGTLLAWLAIAVATGRR